jgi:hypothetical protein
MIIGVPKPISTWEQVAALQVAQFYNADLATFGRIDKALLRAYDVNDTLDDPDYLFDFDAAYRAIESSQLSYFEILALASKLPSASGIYTQKSTIIATDAGHIVICPFSLKGDLDLPIQVWAPLTKMVRSYGFPVLLMGDPGQRLDSVGFTESAITSDWPMEEKIATLASASLIVGTPNAYTWIGTSWDKKIVLFYPQHIPQERWFWFQHKNFPRNVYNASQVQIPVLLAGLRILIDRL